MSQLKGEDRRFIDFNPYSLFSPLPLLWSLPFFFFSNAVLVLLLDTWQKPSMPMHCSVGDTFLPTPFLFDFQ